MKQMCISKGIGLIKKKFLKEQNEMNVCVEIGVINISSVENTTKDH